MADNHMEPPEGGYDDDSPLVAVFGLFLIKRIPQGQGLRLGWRKQEHDADPDVTLFKMTRLEGRRGFPVCGL